MHRPTLLLVEESAVGESALRRAIQKNNVANEALIACDVTTAAGFFAGGDKRDILGLEPNLVLIDIGWAGRDTLDFIQELCSRELSRRPPVVLLISDARRSLISKVRGLGANSLVVMPAEKTALSETILEILVYWLVLDSAAASVI